MSRIVDNLIAYRVLSMLVTPFAESDAFKLGIIDEKGKLLKKVSSLSTTAEKEAYTYLHRLVFNVKRIINRLPGGETKLKNVVAALWLIKESHNKTINQTILEQKFNFIMEKLENNNISLIEEELLVKMFLEDGAVAPANATGAAVSTDDAVIRMNKKKKLDALLMKRK